MRKSLGGSKQFLGAFHVRSGGWSMRVLLLLLGLLVAWGRAAAAQQGEPAQTTLGEWLGCWAIEMQDATPRLGRHLVVRLDSTPAPTRDGPQQYYGRGYEGFPRDGQWPFSLLWVSPARDSLDVSVVSLGGTGWHLKRSGDSLLGTSYEFYDIVPDETPLGPAHARRQACP